MPNATKFKDISQIPMPIASLELNQVKVEKSTS